MSLETILIWVIVGAIAGWLAGLVVRGFVCWSGGARR